MKLEDILKSQGFTDADLAQMSSVLEDQRFRGALEKQYGAVYSELESYKTENERWAEWHEKLGKPALAKFEKEAADARAQAASLQERLKMAEENGFAPRRDDPAPQPQAQPNVGGGDVFDPKKHKLVTEDDVANYAKLQGDAIVMVNDLAAEYSHLTKGGSIFDYETQIDGRTVRGMTALRAEAMQAGKRLDQYVTEKFDFNAKRQAIADEKRKAQEEAIRADERAKVMGQFGDPNSRPLVPSQNPFIPRQSGEAAKQPWEAGTAQERRNQRISRAMEIQSRVQ